MDLHLSGKVAIVTGASKGLGAAAALSLAAEGAYVLALGRDKEGLAATNRAAARLKDGGRIVTEVCDMQDLTAVAALPARAIEVFGRLDIVVNNAGIAPAAKFLNQPEDVWHSVFTTNVMSLLVLTRAAGHILVPQRSGKIINIASTSGLKGKAMLVAYSSSKGAVLQFTTALAAEWAPLGVQVNAIAPGAYETNAQRAVLADEDLLARRIRKIPSGRLGRPEEIGPLVCYLASEVADFVTGSVYVADGGESSSL